jgi:L-malate glycosyltransferase
MKLLLLADARAVHTERYKAALEKKGIRVVLSSMEHAESVDIPIECPTGIQGVDYRLAAGKIKAIIKKVKPDIVDAHSASGYGYAAAVAGMIKYCPLVVHCLGSDILISSQKSVFHKQRIRTSLEGAAAVFVDSEFILGKAEAIYPDADYRVVYWGAEEGIFKLFRPDHDFAIMNHTRSIKAIVPRPHERIYNNWFIIESLANHIVDRHLELHFPDWGGQADEFKKHAAKLNQSGGIDYYSRMPREEYIRFLGSFDMYISASRSDSSPASLIEAMAAGLVPLVGDISGVAELMQNSPELLYDLNNPSSLRGLFKSILDGQLDTKAILRSNHDMIRKAGCFEDNIDSTIQTMQKLIDKDG